MQGRPCPCPDPAAALVHGEDRPAAVLCVEGRPCSSAGHVPGSPCPSPRLRRNQVCRRCRGESTSAARSGCAAARSGCAAAIAAKGGGVHTDLRLLGAGGHFLSGWWSRRPQQRCERTDDGVQHGRHRRPVKLRVRCSRCSQRWRGSGVPALHCCSRRRWSHRGRPSRARRPAAQVAAAAARRCRWG